jgi:hypothetical protein
VLVSHLGGAAGRAEQDVVLPIAEPDPADDAADHAPHDADEHLSHADAHDAGVQAAAEARHDRAAPRR